MDEHFSSTYTPELDLIAIAPDDTWAAVCFCTMDQVADALRVSSRTSSSVKRGGVPPRSSENPAGGAAKRRHVTFSPASLLTARADL
jgi:hypothetical protein